MVSTSERDRVSRIRQALVRLRDEAAELLNVFLAREPLVRGSVYELRRKCGRPSCRCADGELHATMVLSSSEGGRSQIRVIPEGRLDAIRTRAEHYRGFRQARARLVKLHREMIALVDQLEAARRKEP